MNPLEPTKLLDSIDARTKLAGSNKMELLLFSLGTNETFGINVFKVREVSPTPPITLTPNMPAGVEGVISLRGSIIPVITLASFIKLEGAPAGIGETMIVTEFSRHTQGFLVDSVDRIIRVDWDKVKPPENMLAGQDGMITAITELDDGRLVLGIRAGGHQGEPRGIGSRSEHHSFPWEWTCEISGDRAISQV